MDTNYDFGAAVGFPYSAGDWTGVFNALEADLNFGEVTEVKAVWSERENRVAPVMTRMLADDSGAAITCGYNNVRFGYIPTDTATLTFVRPCPDDDSAQVATCFFDECGLVEIDSHDLPADGPTDELISGGALEVAYMPLNPGGHLYPEVHDEMKCRYGYLQLAGLFDASCCATLPADDEDYEAELNFLTALEDLESPINDVECLIRSSERKINEMTGRPFWRLVVEFSGGYILTCCAPDYVDGLFAEHSNPYPEGAIITGRMLLTGRFIAFHWRGGLENSEISAPMAIDERFLPADDSIQGSLAALSSVQCTQRHWSFARDFSTGGVNSDIAGCLGFDYRKFIHMFGHFLFKRSNKSWASRNQLVFDSDSGAVVDANATMTQASPIRSMGPGVSSVIGLSLPGNFWGCAVLVDSEVSTVTRVYAGVDIDIIADRDQVLEGLLDPEEDLWDLECGMYGESRIAAVLAQYPRLHQNPFTNTFFISVIARVAEGEVSILLPCPDWLSGIAVEHGPQSLEVAQALQLLHGRYVVGRFDDCTLSIDAPECFFDDFDSEMRVRTPEPYYVRREQRDRWHISRCYRNPEINSAAAAVAKLDRVGEITLVELMTLLQAGPLSLGFRLSEIYDRMGINIYYTGDGNYQIERDSNEAMWGVLSESPEDFEPRDYAELPVVNEDPSLGDYLTEHDNLDNHLLLLEEAIHKNQKVSMLYGDRNDEPTVRTIRPVQIVSMNHLYLVAWDELREDWRTFRVQRIKMCSLLDEVFQPVNVPLPAEMSENELDYLREKLGESIDTATLLVAWTIWFRS